MKNCILHFIVLFAITIVCFPIVGKTDDSSLSHATQEAPAYGSDAWVKRGKLIFQWADSPAGQITSYCYKMESGKSQMLTNNIGSTSKFLNDQLDSRKAAMDFAKKKLANFLVTVFGTGQNLIITRRFVGALGASIDPKKAVGLPPATAEEKRTFAILVKYASNPTPDIEGNDWVLRFKVMTGDGAVEYWKISGKIHPFQLHYCLREILEPAGTIKVTPTWIPPVSKSSKT